MVLMAFVLPSPLGLLAGAAADLLVLVVGESSAAQNSPGIFLPYKPESPCY